jgi:hypothetical protein
MELRLTILNQLSETISGIIHTFLPHVLEKV